MPDLFVKDVQGIPVMSMGMQGILTLIITQHENIIWPVFAVMTKIGYLKMIFFQSTCPIIVS